MVTCCGGPSHREARNEARGNICLRSPRRFQTQRQVTAVRNIGSRVFVKLRCMTLSLRNRRRLITSQGLEPRHVCRGCGWPHSGLYSLRPGFNSRFFSSPPLLLGRIDDGNWRGWPEGQFRSVITFMVSSKPWIGLRQRLEHRAKQWVTLRVCLCAKLGGLCSVFITHSHRVGRKTHRARRKY